MIERHIDCCPDCCELVAELAHVFGSNTKPTPASPLLERLQPGTRWRSLEILEVVRSAPDRALIRAFEADRGHDIALELSDAGAIAAHREHLTSEAERWLAVSHPAVARVVSVELEGDRLCVARAWIDGLSFAAWMKSARPSRLQVAKVLTDVADGLATAHRSGCVHGSIDPSNIQIDRRCRPWVVGIDPRATCRVEDGWLRRRDAEAAEPSRGHPSFAPDYQAPERLQGDPATAHSDVFSFCVLAHEALFGEHPYRGRNRAELLEAIAVERIHTPSIPRWLRPVAAVLRRGLCPAPSKRLPSLDIVASTLERAMTQRRRTRRRLAMVGLTVTALALGSVALREARRCDVWAADQVASWTPQRREAMRLATLDTGMADARERWIQLESQLDAYEKDWMGRAVTACRTIGTEVERRDGAQAHRLACLSNGARRFDALLDLYERPDRTLLTHASLLLSKLSWPDGCDDQERLGRLASLPEHPNAQLWLDAARARIARADLLIAIGKPGSALEALADIEIASLRHPPLSGEVEWTRGRAHVALGNDSQGQRHLRRALSLARAGGHDWLVHAASAVLVRVSHRLTGDPMRGLSWIAGLDHDVELAAPDERTRAERLEARADVLTAARRLPEALDAARRALHLIEGRLGPASARAAIALGRLGTIHATMGDLSEADRMHRRSLALLEATVTKEHPEFARALLRHARTLVALKLLAQALERREVALDILEETLPPEHPDRARAHGELRALLLRLERWDEALFHAREALRLDLRAPPGHEHRVALDRYELAGIEMQLGRTKNAIANLRTAAEILNGGGSSNPPLLDSVLVRLARAEVSARRP